jgi:xanthine/uracil permease
MSQKRKFKEVLQTISVVIGSFVGAIVIIVAATTKYDFSQPEEVKIVKKKGLLELNRDFLF